MVTLSIKKGILLNSRNVINSTLVSGDKIILPLLHVILGLVKQFVKVLEKMAIASTVFVNNFLML